MRRTAHGIVLTALLLAAPSTGLASSKPAKVYLALFGGVQSYAMTDLGNRIEANNVALEGTGFSVEPIRRGFAYGAGVRVWPSDRVCLLLDYTHLDAARTSQGRVENELVGVHFDLPANALTLSAGVFQRWHAVRYGLGGGGGYYLCSGTLEADVASDRAVTKVRGHGPGFQLLALGMVKVSSLNFEGGIGYRFARTTDLTSGGVTVALDGVAQRADWNGLVTRFGISVPFDPAPYHPDRDSSGEAGPRHAGD